MTLEKRIKEGLVKGLLCASFIYGVAPLTNPNVGEEIIINQNFKPYVNVLKSPYLALVSIGFGLSAFYKNSRKKDDSKKE